MIGAIDTIGALKHKPCYVGRSNAEILTIRLLAPIQ